MTAVLAKMFIEGSRGVDPGRARVRRGHCSVRANGRVGTQPIIARMSDSDRALLGGADGVAVPAASTGRSGAAGAQRRARIRRHVRPRHARRARRARRRRIAARRQRAGARYALAHGPFRRADFKALPARGWTLLVQGLNLHCDEADALLRRFAFMPYARLDDVMVSYAAPGGGVGPHFDSYDVFLLQGFGRRRWRYGRQRDLSLRARPAGQDPAHVHALARRRCWRRATCSTCRRSTRTTASRSTRARPIRSASAPRARRSWRTQLSRLPARSRRRSRAATPTPVSRPTREPARIGRRMQRRTRASSSKRLRWDARHVARFLGSHLSEPKATVVFDPPRTARSRCAAFAKRIARRKGVAPGSPHAVALRRRALYVNGTRRGLPRRARTALRDARQCATPVGPRNARALPGDTLALLHDWYRHGFLTPAMTPRRNRAGRDAARHARRAGRRDRRARSISRGSACRCSTSTCREGGWNGARRAERTRELSCGASRHARLTIIVHDTRYLESVVPAARRPAEVYSHAMQI